MTLAQSFLAVTLLNVVAQAGTLPSVRAAVKSSPAPSGAAKQATQPRLLLPAAVVDACPSQPIAPSAKPVLCGTTSSMATGAYTPLDGVQVTVYRKAPVGQGFSVSGGNFKVEFPPGTPVTALFKGPNDQLPALQQLKAQTGTMHTVHVTLLTPQEARSQGINSYQYVQSIIDQLRAVGVSDGDEQVQALVALRNRVG